MKLSEAITKFAAWKQYASKKETARSYATQLRQFALFVQDKDIEAVTLEDVLNFFRLMEEIGWDVNSFLTKSIALRKLFEFYGKQSTGILDYELIPIKQREYKFPKMTTDEDVRKLLSVMDTASKYRARYFIRNKAIIQILWKTGARMGEIISLNLEDIDLVKMRAVIKTEKSKGVRPVRQIMWDHECNEVLKQWIEVRRTYDLKSKALFINTVGVHAGGRIYRRAIGEFLRRYSKTAGLDYVCNAHRFRHAFGRDLAKKGANNSVISSLLGHANLQSSYVYTAMDDKMLQEQYDKFRK